MRTIFHVDFLAGDAGGSLGFARLEQDLSFAPTKEIEFEQPVWSSGRRPTSVTFNLEASSFYVTLGFDKMAKDQLVSHAQMYRDHGWDVTD